MDFVRLDRADTVVTATRSLSPGSEVERIAIRSARTQRAGCLRAGWRRVRSGRRGGLRLRRRLGRWRVVVAVISQRLRSKYSRKGAALRVRK